MAERTKREQGFIDIGWLFGLIECSGMSEQNKQTARKKLLDLAGLMPPKEPETQS